MRIIDKTSNGYNYSHLLLPLLSAVLLIAAFPPFEQGYLAWFALLPLIGSSLQINPLYALRAGFIFGIPFNLYLNFYLTKVLFPYLPTPLNLVAMILLVLYLSLFYGLFAVAVSLVQRLGRAWFTALAIPALWLCMEYLRSLSFMAYNVGYLGYSQWSYPYLLNIVSSYGYWGLPFIMILFQSIVTLSLRRDLHRTELIIPGAVFFILLGCGLVLPLFQPLHEADEQLIVGLIQGNSDPETVIRGERAALVDHYLKLTQQAFDQNPSITLVVWPETVVDLDLGKEEVHPAAMLQKSEELAVNFLYGARVRDGEKLFNSIALIDAGHDTITLYHKKRLVPFVEYFPLEDLLNRMLKLQLLLGSYSAGEEITIFYSDEIPLAGVICFESYFGDHTRLFAAAGSRHLFVLTNDAWFGESIGLDQHAQVAAIRAAEMGIGVTQVANSGITISFDYQGHELFRSGKNESAVFTLPLDLTTRNTLYRHYGDYFPAFWALFLLFSIPALIIYKA
jgi:apolipoprotein N-acyltransferase